MQLSPEQTKTLASLRNDGDEMMLADDRKLVLSIGQDEWTSINDFDCYGKVEFAEYSDGARPNGYDGRALKLSYGNVGPYWWQPPSDVPDESLRGLGSQVAQLLAFGFSEVRVKVMELLTDSMGQGHWIVVDVGSMGGMDNVDDEEYLQEVVENIVSDFLGE